jgi:nicotinate phosphoribosyltransferase
MENGKRTEPEVPAKEIAAYVKHQLSNEIWEEEQRFENPHIHFLDMTPKYYEMKMEMLNDKKGEN